MFNENSINVGQALTVKIMNGGLGSAKRQIRVVKGKVIYKNDCFFTVQGEKYPESFKYTDVMVSEVQVKINKNN